MFTDIRQNATLKQLVEQGKYEDIRNIYLVNMLLIFFAGLILGIYMGGYL